MIVAGLMLWPLTAADFPIAVHAAPTRDAALTQRMQDHWRNMQSANPRLFDGPLLTLRHINCNTGTLTLQRDTYMPYAVQPHIDTDTISLGVTAILAHGAGAQTAYLFGKRAAKTHMYPNQWELGPSGAVAPPDGASLTLRHLHNQLTHELNEEIGLALPLTDANAVPMCVVLDPIARSIDIVMLITLADLPTLAVNWEYQSVAWVTAREFSAWAESRAVIAPTVAIMRWLTDRHS